MCNQAAKLMHLEQGRMLMSITTLLVKKSCFSGFRKRDKTMASRVLRC